jgi:hypothetical protein
LWGWYTSPKKSLGKVRAFLKRLIGRILMRAAFITALGTMLIPLGVFLAIDKPELEGLAFLLIIAGLVSFGGAWYYTIKEERRQDEIEKQRQKEHESRMRGDKATFFLITHIAEKLGVDINKIAKDMGKLLDGK